MSSHHRGDLAVPAAGKNDGNENQDLSEHSYTAAHESGDRHKGAVTGTVEYFGGEFIVRVRVAGRDWHFRASTSTRCATRCGGSSAPTAGASSWS
jgi:hypothetical protein